MILFLLVLAGIFCLFLLILQYNSVDAQLGRINKKNQKKFKKLRLEWLKKEEHIEDPDVQISVVCGSIKNDYAE